VQNSGLSFGAHQIDLGANEDKELRIFWDVIDAFRARNPDAALDKAKLAKDCINLPLRLMTVGALALTYQSTPKLTGALRAGDGFEEYNKRLIDYLTEEARITNAKPGLFKQSLITRILFSDVKNQSGSGARVATLAAKRLSEGTDLRSCTAIAKAEDRTVNDLVFINPNDPAKRRTRFAKRYENIRDLVRSRVAKGGLSGCS
jgi:hypothetical protein